MTITGNHSKLLILDSEIQGIKFLSNLMLEWDQLERWDLGLIICRMMSFIHLEMKTQFFSSSCFHVNIWRYHYLQNDFFSSCIRRWLSLSMELSFYVTFSELLNLRCQNNFLCIFMSSYVLSLSIYFLNIYNSLEN